MGDPAPATDVRPPRVKICGLTRLEDARGAERAGASYVGAILVPGSPRRVQLDRALQLSEGVAIPLVVVIADLEIGVAAWVAERARAGAIQMHGEETVETVRELRQRGPWELWKAVRVRSRDDVLAAMDRFGPWVDLLLFDAWKKGRLGGTGAVFPWEAMAALGPSRSSGPLIGVAGGLSPENVEEAVARLSPDLVDVSSGVETAPGIKDPMRVQDFVRRATSAGGPERSVS